MNDYIILGAKRPHLTKGFTNVTGGESLGWTAFEAPESVAAPSVFNKFSTCEIKVAEKHKQITTTAGLEMNWYVI